MNFDDRDNAEFLSEEGQLKYELTCQMDHYREQGNLTQDVIIHFMNEGTRPTCLHSLVASVHRLESAYSASIEG